MKIMDEREDIEKCPKCGGYMKNIIVNNGFEPPNPPKLEIVGAECVICGYKEE